VVEVLLFVEESVQVGIDALESGQRPAALEGLGGFGDLGHDAGNQRLADSALTTTPPPKCGTSRARVFPCPYFSSFGSFIDVSDQLEKKCRNLT